MRRLILFILYIILLVILTALTVARAGLPGLRAVPASADPGYGYNILPMRPAVPAETAGSAMIAEMDRYFLYRTPTAKSAVTGAFRGKNLVLVCAENWDPDPTDSRRNPALHRLWRDGARFTNVYRPDWYQGPDGREFALLSGLMPTRVNDGTALKWTGEQKIYLPYTLVRCLGAEGYATLACLPDGTRSEAYEALGFDRSVIAALPSETVSASEDLFSEAPFFVVYIWRASDCGSALALLSDSLARAGHDRDTVICLYAGNAEEYRGRLFLWSASMPDLRSDLPCCELDVTPTLLNLFGAAFDSRFLSGRDIFAGNHEPGTASAAAPLVSLSGNAYPDWITDAGSFFAADSMFLPGSVSFPDAGAMVRYVQAMCGYAYDRYIYARRVMEYNYFQLVPGT